MDGKILRAVKLRGLGAMVEQVKGFCDTLLLRGVSILELL